jgi:hypothetical protein
LSEQKRNGKLLAKALAFRPKRKTTTKRYGIDEIEVYVGWLEGTLDLPNVAHALDIPKSRTSVISLQATQAIKQGIQDHMIGITWFPKKTDKERVGL